MGDHIIDTNVLLVASARHPGSPFKDSEVPAEQQQVVLNWLMALGVTGRPLATSPVFLGIFGLSARSAALSWDTPETCTLRDGSEELSPLDGLTTEDTAETPLFSA